MATSFKICRICATVSGTWLAMSAFVAMHLAPRDALEIPIALLMGGSVIGISYQRQSMRWKITTIAIGMPLAYALVINVSIKVVFIEIIALCSIAYFLFAKKSGGASNNTRALEEKMKQCC